MVAWLQLSTEVWTEIIRHIWDPPPIPTCPWGSDTLGNWYIVEGYDKYEERRNREALVRFSLASRRLAAIAHDRLWHFVALRTGKSISSLSKTLNAKPELGQRIRHLYCLEDLEATTVDEYEHKAPSGRYSPVFATSQDKEQLQACFNVILTFSPHIQTLMYLFPYGSTLLQSAWPVLWNGVQAIPSSNGAVYPTFSKLKRLQLCRDIHDGNYRDSYRNGTFSCNVVPLLQHLSSLHTLELLCDDGETWKQHSNGMTEVLVPPEPPTLKSLELPNLRHIRLLHSWINEPDLAHLCFACTNLQTLVVQFEYPYDISRDQSLVEGDASYDPNHQHTSFVKALAARTNTLEHLEVLSPPRGNFLSHTHNEKRRLSCLPHMINLKRLRLDWRGLFGPYDTVDAAVAQLGGLDALLPPRLESFDLICCWNDFLAHDENAHVRKRDVDTTLALLKELHRQAVDSGDVIGKRPLRRVRLSTARENYSAKPEIEHVGMPQEGEAEALFAPEWQFSWFGVPERFDPGGMYESDTESEIGRTRRRCDMSQ